jgi:hypothetical protein
MKVYVVEEFLNEDPENGGGFQGIAAVFTDKAKAIEFCKPQSLFEDYELADGETYYEYVECEVD